MLAAYFTYKKRKINKNNFLIGKQLFIHSKFHLHVRMLESFLKFHERMIKALWKKCENCLAE